MDPESINSINIISSPSLPHKCVVICQHDASAVVQCKHNKLVMGGHNNDNMARRRTILRMSFMAGRLPSSRTTDGGCVLLEVVSRMEIQVCKKMGRGGVGWIAASMTLIGDLLLKAS